MSKSIPVWIAALSLQTMLTGCEGCEGSPFSRLVPMMVPSQTEITLDPGWIGYTVSRDVKLQNVGTADVMVRRITLAGDGFRLPDAHTDVIVAVNTALTVEVEFAPTREGAHSGSLAITSNADNAPELTIALNGNGHTPPDCDDDNPCSVDAFDPELGSCQHQLLDEVPCQDNDLCTEATECVEGVCKGTAVNCPEPPDQCKIGFCDPAEGCRYIQDPEACDDVNPCTRDICDPTAGCLPPSYVPDGTPCAAMDGCRAIHLCLLGTCTEFEVPDGTPCADGDFCTVEDHCQAGECVGTTVAIEPEVMGQDYLVGGRHSEVTFLPDGRLVVGDGGGTIVDSYNTMQVGFVFQVFDLSGPEPVRDAIGTFARDARRMIALYAVSDDRFISFANALQSDVRVYGITEAGAVEERFNVTPSGRTISHAAAAEGVLYLCDPGASEILIRDISGEAPGTLNVVSAPEGCRALLVDPTTSSLWVSDGDGSGLGKMLYRYDLADPLTPQPGPGLGWYRRDDPGRKRTIVSADIHSGTVAVGVELGSGSEQEVFFLDAVYTGDDPPVARATTIRGPLQLTPDALYLLGDGQLRHYPRIGDGLGQFDQVLVAATAGDDFEAWNSWVAVEGGTRGSMRLFSWTASSGEERSLPGQGASYLLRAMDNRVVSYSHDALHTWSVSPSGTVSPTNGTLFSSQVGIYRVPTLLPIGGAHTFGSWDPADTYWYSQQVTMVDAGNVALPAVLGTLELDDLDYNHPHVAIGDHLFTFRKGYDGEPRPLQLLRYDIPEAGFGDELPYTVILEYQPQGLDSLYSHQVMAADQRNEDLVLLAWSDHNVPTQLHLLQLDEAHTSAQEIGWGTIPGGLMSMKLRGDLVAALLDDGYPASLFSGTTLHVGTITGPDALTTRSLEIPDANHILLFDGVNVLVATKQGIVYVRVEQDELRQIGLLETLQPPVSVAPVGNMLAIGANTTLTVASPPCPPID